MCVHLFLAPGKLKIGAFVDVLQLWPQHQAVEDRMALSRFFYQNFLQFSSHFFGSITILDSCYYFVLSEVILLLVELTWGDISRLLNNERMTDKVRLNTYLFNLLRFFIYFYMVNLFQLKHGILMCWIWIWFYNLKKYDMIFLNQLLMYLEPRYRKSCE